MGMERVEPGRLVVPMDRPVDKVFEWAKEQREVSEENRALADEIAGLREEIAWMLLWIGRAQEALTTVSGDPRPGTGMAWHALDVALKRQEIDR